MVYELVVGFKCQLPTWVDNSECVQSFVGRIAKSVTKYVGATVNEEPIQKTHFLQWILSYQNTESEIKTPWWTVIFLNCVLKHTEKS